MPQSIEQTSSTHHADISSQTEPPAAPDFADRVFPKFHQHNVSDSTSASNDSSPTTTISTVDDSSATDPSPESSPESPPPSTFAPSMLRPRTADNAGTPFFELQKQPPPKKGRNLKNLAVNTSRNVGRAASTTSLPLPAPDVDNLSALASPAFVKPPSPPKTKRRPSNLGLTLLTPGASRAPPKEIKLAIPPTPSFGRPGTLRHFQSSPSLPLFPKIDLPAGVRPREAHAPLTLETILSPIEPPKNCIVFEEEDEEQNFDIPLSREEKPEAYPDGPICVYEPYIDLYLEPTAEQCRKYDVIMNVASEVRNPLIEQAESNSTEPELRIDGGGGIQYAPKRPHLAAVMSEAQDLNNGDSPTTPKATPLISTFPSDVPAKEDKRDPEYIHIKWEHNSDIVPDLLRLVKLIDERVKHGKRVLIHCQCGVSRSASLVVAYGLYKDPTMSVQEAYDTIKKRSKWIGPNMNLIMQLQEFRTSLTRGGILLGNRGLTPITPSSAFSEWQRPFATDSVQIAPHNGPLSAGIAPYSQPAAAGPTSAISPGPSSAPSGLAWPLSDQPPVIQTQRARAVSAVKTTAINPSTTAYVDPSGHVVPVLKVLKTEPRIRNIEIAPSNPDAQDSGTPTERMTSPRSVEFAPATIQPQQAAPPGDFGLMSPTSTGFTSSPFDRSALLASLGMGSIRESDEPPPRRSLSLRSRSKRPSEELQPAGLQPHQGRRLRGKVSSPNLREQKQLQSLQAKIEARLPHRAALGAPLGRPDEALMSPRATEFTKNPFALPPTIHVEASEAETPPPTTTAVSDPRSPAQIGVSPITRNIMDVL